MYSGSTLTTFSGRILGAHQKIDRVARKHLELLLPDVTFPSIKAILYFEGDNGPDGIKRKSPGKDEPWHFYQPFDDADVGLPKTISDHYNNLVAALAAQEMVKAGFEAAWLSHAVVDGLTPAHHFPYGERLAELRDEGINTRDSIKNKLVLPGKTRWDQIGNNWKMWGPKGLFTTHSAFELGVATVIAPLSLSAAMPDKEDVATYMELGPVEWFKREAREIAQMGLYAEFYKNGWNNRLAQKIRKLLVPAIVRTVTLLWYGAAVEAQTQKI